MPYVLIVHQNSPPYSAIAERLLEAQTDQVYRSQTIVTLTERRGA